MEREAHKILESLPGKNCGQCGFQTCAELAAFAAAQPDVLKRCIYREKSPPATTGLWSMAEEITWADALGREYEFILEQFPEDPGPRETIVPLNPATIGKLAVKKGDILYGRPALVGCPVTHVGVVVEEPDYLNGAITWCIVGPLAARDQGREIGYYQIVAYDGLVRHSREELQIGRRYYFLPRTCVLLSRHSGLISALAKRGDETRVRLEGIWIG